MAESTQCVDSMKVYATIWETAHDKFSQLLAEWNEKLNVAIKERDELINQDWYRSGFFPDPTTNERVYNGSIFNCDELQWGCCNLASDGTTVARASICKKCNKHYRCSDGPFCGKLDYVTDEVCSAMLTVNRFQSRYETEYQQLTGKVREIQSNKPEFVSPLTTNVCMDCRQLIDISTANKTNIHDVMLQNQQRCSAFLNGDTKKNNDAKNSDDTKKSDDPANTDDTKDTRVTPNAQGWIHNNMKTVLLLISSVIVLLLVLLLVVYSM